METIVQRGGRAQFVSCDVTDPAAQRTLFSSHLSTFGSLDIFIANAGIGESVELFGGDPGLIKWRKTLDIDLTSAIQGNALAVQAMRATRRPGLIVNVASAAGIFPMAPSPVYSAAKVI